MSTKLGSRLRRERETRGMGLREAATKLEISPTYLSRIETGKEKSPPAEKVIQAMAWLYRTDADDLLALAGRVSNDVAEFIISDANLARFLRIARLKQITGARLIEWLSA